MEPIIQLSAKKPDFLSIKKLEIFFNEINTKELRQKEEGRKIKEFYNKSNKREEINEEVMRFDIDKEEEGASSHLLVPTES